MNSYYQLVKIVQNENTVCNKARKNNLNPISFEIDGCGKLLAFELSSLDPKKLEKFEKATRNLDMNYFLFTDNIFGNLIKSAHTHGIQIRSIRTSGNEEVDTRISEYLLNGRYFELTDYLQKNEINIKNIELSSNKDIMRLYDSGICLVRSKLLKSNKLGSLINNILSFACKMPEDVTT